MLERIRSVTRAVSLAEGLNHTLEVIVAEVCRTLKVEVCSIYITDFQQQQFILMASMGLNPDVIGELKLNFNQGLIGLVAQREEPIHLQEAGKHPNYHFFPESAEEEFNAFLGVPIIHQRKVLGVLVIQQKESRQFGPEEETFLITLAAQLPAVLIDNELSQIFISPEKRQFTRSIHGIAASQGVAVGKTHVIFPSQNIHDIPDKKSNDSEKERKKMTEAVRLTHLQLEKMSMRMEGKVSEQELALFDAYQQILSSKGVADEVEEFIREGYWGPTALRKVVQQHLKAFRSMSDPYLRERANDIEDLANRVLAQYFKSEKTKQPIGNGAIIVAQNITAAMIAELPMDKISGFVSVRGSSTSHAAILSKALGIPAVMGLENCPINHLDGQYLVVDGYNGEVILAPTKSQLKHYQSLLREEKQLAKELIRDRGLPSQTCCGLPIKLMLNSGTGTDREQVDQTGANGIGLYRTEIPFMRLQQFPSEEEQVKIYSKLLKDFEDLSVTIRTLDIGGDKQLDYFPISEENPFLGWRGIRVTLDHPEIFLVQLRAILKASVGCQTLKLALPMVSTIDELDEAYRLFEQAFAEVTEELADINVTLFRPKIGLILEVPASVFQLSRFAKKVDFISVGTNDLIQYMMAVDRNNVRVKSLYSHFQPAIVHLLEQVARDCEKAKLELQICGEMAADPLAAVLLIGMGYKELSMNIGSLTKVKRAISRFTLEEMQTMVNAVKMLDTETQVKSFLMKSFEEKGLGGLVRAGL